MSDPRFDPPILHVHGQRYPKDALEVFGTTAGLERLINALIDAVNTGRGRGTFVVRDGHEAELQVACLEGVRREEDWRRSGSPYLEVEDPLVARIIDLTDENARLRNVVAQLRKVRTAGIKIDYRDGAETGGGACPPTGS